MRVRLLSGNQTGVIEEVSEPEGEHLLMSQLAELAPIEAAADVAPEPAEGASLAEPDESTDAETDPDPAGVPASRTRTRTKKPTDPASRRKRR